MSDDEYYRVGVSHIQEDEAEPSLRRLSDLRLKLMEIADKVEAGVYTELSMNYFANNHLQQSITVGYVGTTMGADGHRGSYWDEVKVDIPDEDDFDSAYKAFMDDATIWLDSYCGEDPNQIEEVIVFIGDNRSEGDTTKFFKIPQKS